MKIRPCSLRFLLAAVFSVTYAHASAVDESWQLLLINGQEAGYTHTEVRVLNEGGATYYETSQEMSFSIKRLGTPVSLATEVVQTEDERGQILRMRQTAHLSNNATVSEGVVRGGKLYVKTTTVGAPHESVVEEWPTDMPGPEELRRRIVMTGFAPGATIDVHQFDFSVGFAMTGEILIEEPETIEIEGKPQQLFRTILSLDEGMPETTSWVDSDGKALKTSFSMMGMTFETIEVEESRVRQYRRESVPAEIFVQSTINANVRLPRPRSLDSITYRVKAHRGDLPDLGAAPTQQWIGEPDPDGSRLLRIDVRVPPNERQQAVGMKPTATLADYLSSNPLMQCDDPALRDFAQKTTLDEHDAWRAAVRLERAVYERIDKKSMDVAFASALETFQTQNGDCSEHAVLLGALCRSAGIPSRVVMGLVYVGGIFGGHAWAEVSIDGAWYPLDATIGRGSVDPTHIALGTSSLKDGSFSGGLLASLTSLGNLDLTILDYRQGETTVHVDGEGHRSLIEEGRFTDFVEGVSFVIPAGFKVAPGATDLTEMSNRYVLAELGADEETTTLMTLAARQIAYEFTLETFQRDVERRLRRGVEASQVKVGGYAGLLLDFDDTDGAGRAVGFLVDDTLYTLNGRNLDERGTTAFDSVVRSLQLDRR